MKFRLTAVRAAALSFVTTCCCGPLPAWAQPARLPETVVSASLIEQRVQDALPATTLITRADIERAQTPDLLNLLRDVVGLEVVQTGGPGTVGTVFLRGAESRHTLVLIDGVAVNNLNFGLAALEHLSLAQVDRIEIVRGNVSSLYGSAALGGVISIFTREAGEQSYAHVTLQTGSRGMAQLQTGAGVKTAAGTRLSFTTENLSDDGINAINQSKRPGTNPDIDGYSRRSYSVGLAQDLSIGRIALTTRETTGKTAYDSQFGPANQKDESQFTLQSTALSGQFRLGPRLQLDASASSHIDRLRADVTAFPYFVHSFADAGALALRWQLAPRQTLTGGLESTHQRLESDTVYNRTSRQQDSTRLGYQADFERHQLQLNLRQDRYSDFGTADTWFAGYGYRLTPAWRAHASVSTGFTAPTFNDLYYPWGGNPNLRPEQLRSTEAGLQYATTDQELRITWFDNHYTDLIANDASWTRVNINRARIDGYELSHRARWGATTLRSGLTLQNPQDLGSNKRLDRRAVVLARLGLTHERGPWGLGATLRYSGERPDAGRILESYTVLDLTIHRALRPDLKLFARVENALDAQYETAFGYNQTRFGVFAGLSWQPRF